MQAFITTFRELMATLPKVAAQTGRPLWRIALAFVRCYMICRVTPEEFHNLQLYDLSNQKLSEFLTTRRQINLKKKYFNVGAGPEDFACYEKKHLFLDAFAPFIGREHLYMPESTPDEVCAFIDRNPKFIMKTDMGTQGKGVFLCRREELDIDRFIAENKDKPVLLDAYVRQHPDMEALNPTSVNTVRVVTARYQGKVLIAGVMLRCGGAGSHLDNFHAGGVVYPVDIDTGVILGPGRRDGELKGYLRHPSTGRVMPGFQIPHWDILLRTLPEAALHLPGCRVGYLGWDVAITPEGVTFIEANPACHATVIQFDGVGKYKRIRDFLAENQ